MLSEEGLKHRSKRPIEPEAVFGQIKSDNKFNRLLLRRLPKVKTEIGLVVISHNLRKLAQNMPKNLKNILLSTFFAKLLTILGACRYMMAHKRKIKPAKVHYLGFRFKNKNTSNLAA